MPGKCVHKGCGKTFADDNEECVYHPGPPVFHEGQKGWKCCKPRVLTFDEFMTIPPCTTGKHSTVDDTPAEEPKTAAADAPTLAPPATEPAAPGRAPTAQAPQAPQPPTSPAPPEDEDDDPSTPVPENATCKRKTCGVTHKGSPRSDEENCQHHPGAPIFHEGSKGWSCCKRRVLEFDEFLRIPGCKTKSRHLFVGARKDDGEEKLDSVRHDFYQTVDKVMASLYLKKIDKSISRVEFQERAVDLDLRTSDKKRFTQLVPLFGLIDVEKSEFSIMGTKLELRLAKADGASWPVLRGDEKHAGEIIQIGRAGRA
ncbi:CORD and CS domain protein [Aureobasidium subglaciale]|nr:CORD and CS domain protein [Aureobasidium subglaciale]